MKDGRKKKPNSSSREDFLKKLYLIAYEYYVNGKTQQEIAEQLGTHRVLISKYLKQARELGLVEVRLKDPLFEDTTYKKLFLKHFNLKDIIVVSFPFYKEEKDYHVGASLVGRILDGMLTNGMIVGIGWGSTLEIISKHLHPTKKLSETVFLPLMGGTNQLPHYFRANDFVRNFAESYNAKPKYIFAPFYIENPSQKELLLSSGDLRETIEFWKKLDLAIVGIGCYIQKSPLFQNKIFDEKYLRSLLENNVVGDVLTYFFNENGEVVNLAVYKNLVNIPLEDFLKIPTRVGIAGGLQKVQSIVGALRGGLVNVLITDDKTAEMILRYLGT
ncbi:sugar-binding transcriptional regulator [Thermotoga sp.]|uniref:sugar-binding transcriptional regulator n=1 Tax=Thermotoga sp. TaxID=28240 RepID=UPI0025F8B693|nr:sugar-binding transcriptional regulator [Thermotoga sp.]MCD6551878.1 sugar-binding transcriptional regulator [Thermotoga sp.]